MGHGRARRILSPATMDLPRRLMFSVPDPSPSYSALLPRSLIQWRQGPALRRSIGRPSLFSSTTTILGAANTPPCSPPLYKVFYVANHAGIALAVLIVDGRVLISLEVDLPFRDAISKSITLEVIAKIMQDRGSRLQDLPKEMMSNQITPECFKEGLILCDKESLKGHQGVSLDVLVGILPCLEKEMEEIVLHKTFKLAEKVASIMEEPEPCLSGVPPANWADLEKSRWIKIVQRIGQIGRPDRVRTRLAV